MKRALPTIIALVALVVATTSLFVHVGGSTEPVESTVVPATVTRVGSPEVARDPIIQVVERVQPAIVNVTTDTLTSTPFGTQSGQGVGSGFIIRSDGIVVTNYHVVEGAQRITIITPPPSNEHFEARVIGGDETADLAVLKVDATGLPTVPMGTSSNLQLGQKVVALGYALALKGGPSVTTGVVSALGRVVEAQDPNYQPGNTGGGTRTYRDAIQTDAAINPGNSGGPLLNLQGQVVGINTAGAGQAENIGFAIAIDAARSTIANAVANPNKAVAYLGVVTRSVTSDVALQYALPVDSGAYVVDITKDGPAGDADIRPGDVIVEFNGQKVVSSQQLGNLIHGMQPGAKVDAVVARSDGNHTLTATLGTNPLP